MNDRAGVLVWKDMSAAEIASFKRAQGEKVVESGSGFWMEIRPFFYRPLLPFKECHPEMVRAPWLGYVGAYQFAVPPGETSNSALSLLMFENAPGYTLQSLESKRRWEVRTAAKRFQIRPLTDVEEFKKLCYPVYLSFYERTRYDFKSDRRRQSEFNRWADCVFQSKLLVFGAWRRGAIESVSISLRHAETVVHLAAFSNSTAAHEHVNSLMLHALRAAAARAPGVKRIFAGMDRPQDRTSLSFQLLRGCSVVKKPAYCRINPLADAILRWGLPDWREGLARIRGGVPAT